MMENPAQKVRERVNIGEVLALYGLQATRAGFLHCPFHSGDRSPSLKIYSEQNTWHCFGCGKGGTVLDFVMEFERCSLLQAVKRLDRAFHLGLSDSKESYREYRQRLSERQRKEKEQQSAKIVLDTKIAQRRALWLALKETQVVTHEQAQQAAKTVGEIERLDEQIRQSEGFRHKQISRAVSMDLQQAKARNSFGTFSESTKGGETNWKQQT